jgi:hypothetical protein
MDTDDFVRAPDEIHRERLIDEQEDQDEELQRVLEMSMNEFLKENNFKNDKFAETVDIDNVERMIHQSLLDEIERNQKIETEMKKREEDYKIVLEKRRKKYALLLNRIKLMIQKNYQIKDTLYCVFEKYFTSYDVYTYVSQQEYEIFSDFLHYIYSIPKYESSRTIINNEDYEELVKSIVTKENKEELYYFHKKWIQDCTKEQILEKKNILDRQFI